MDLQQLPYDLYQFQAGVRLECTPTPGMAQAGFFSFCLQTSGGNEMHPDSPIMEVENLEIGDAAIFSTTFFCWMLGEYQIITMHPWEKPPSEQTVSMILPLNDRTATTTNQDLRVG